MKLKAQKEEAKYKEAQEVPLGNLVRGKDESICIRSPSSASDWWSVVPIVVSVGVLALISMVLTTEAEKGRLSVALTLHG